MRVLGITASGVANALPPGYESIATVTLASAQSTITFNSIPQTYTSLQIRGNIRWVNTYNYIGVRPNGATSASSWSNHSIEFPSGSSPMATYYTGNVSMIIGVGNGNLIGTYNSTNIIVDIHDYASTTRNKTFRSISGFDGAGSSASYLGVHSGAYLSTTALTSLTFIAGANFNTGSTLALYGIKAAV